MTHLHSNRDCITGASVLHNGGDKGSHRETNGPGSVALQFDDLIRTVTPMISPKQSTQHTKQYLLTTSLCISLYFSGSSAVPTRGFRSLRRTPAMFTPDHTGTANTIAKMQGIFTKKLHNFSISCNSFECRENFAAKSISLPEESPCSPIIHPWQEDGATLSFCERWKRNLEESRLVPDPITRCLGRPESFHVTYVMISTATEFS
ncbi:hypothetical protein E2C01_010975 [Portunus trituberculatus]|uniref:Uncharacterized protein n=1 Tax=Portunus trituberculatus TaxID=210409 RepID=A0A5B7D9V2_PORTR|nr:hypothetical protein [Portunus trituberculatus]